MVHCSVLCFIRRKRNCYNSMSVRLRHIPTWSCGRTFSKHIVLKRSYTFGVFCYLHRQKWWRSLKLQSDKNLENWMCSSWLYLNFPIYILVLQLRFVPLLYHYKSDNLQYNTLGRCTIGRGGGGPNKRASGCMKSMCQITC